MTWIKFETLTWLIWSYIKAEYLWQNIVGRISLTEYRWQNIVGRISLTEYRWQNIVGRISLAEYRCHNSWYVHRLSYSSVITLRSSAFWHVAFQIHIDVSGEDSASGFRIEVIGVRTTRTTTLIRRRYRRSWRQYVPLESRNVSARIYGVTIESPHSQFYRLIYRLSSARSYNSE